MEPHGNGSRAAERRESKFDRLIRILQMLILEGRCTTKKLEEEFSVSRKTILRDMDVLSLCFPIRDEPDPNDPHTIWWVIEGRDITKSRLSIEEQLGLLVAKKAKPFGDAFRDILEQVERKALRASGPISRRLPLDAFVFTTPGDDSARMLRNKLLVLAEASTQDKCLDIVYKTLFRGETNKRRIEPAYLFCSTDGFWYVVAFCRKVNEWRTFAVDQILEHQLLNESAKEKLSSDKQKDVSAGFGAFHRGEMTSVVIRFSPYIRPYIERRRWHESETMVEVDDEILGKGSLELRMETTGLEGVKHWLMQWMPDIRVIEPVSLKHQLAQELTLQLQRL